MGLNRPPHPVPLRTVLIEVEPQGKGLALVHQRCRLHDVRRGDVVQRADLVIRAPFAPVPETLGHVVNRTQGHILFQGRFRHHLHLVFLLWHAEKPKPDTLVYNRSKDEWTKLRRSRANTQRQFRCVRRRALLSPGFAILRSAS